MTPHTYTRRHVSAFDLLGIKDRNHKAVIQGALNACDFPMARIRKQTGKRVPVTIADTSRFAADANAHAEHTHGGGYHVLEDTVRRAALGLFWLPTPEYPAGRIEISHQVMDDVALAQEVFLAEAAHSVDYGAMTDAHRDQIFSIVHGGDSTPHDTHGWFEERGGQDYWSDWVGEVFMGLFMRAFAPSLPRPLEARQPWTHKVTDEMSAQARKALLRKGE